jgi:hypothetical protein
MFPVVSAPEKLSLSGLSRGDLEALIERLLAENAALKQAIGELRAEIAALKGGEGSAGDPAERHGAEDRCRAGGRQARQEAAQDRAVGDP